MEIGLNDHKTPTGLRQRLYRNHSRETNQEVRRSVSKEQHSHTVFYTSSANHLDQFQIIPFTVVTRGDQQRQNDTSPYIFSLGKT